MNEAGKSGLSCATAQKRSADWSDETGVIYFVSCKVAEFPIKIGWTADIEQRLVSLKSGLPHEPHLLLQIPGTPELERSLHLSFRAHKVQGEWFARHPEIMDFIHLNRTSRVWL